jgi:hypothetical protein
VRPLGTPAALCALVGALALAGCSGDEPAEEPAGSPSESQTSEEPPPPPPPAPEAGACYRLSVDDAEAASTDAEPVDCRQQHTARTAFVGTVTRLAGADATPDDPAVAQQLSDDCRQRGLAFLGGDPVTQNLSRFVTVGFVPPAADIDAGADWYRCDVVAFGSGEKLLPLPFDRRLAGILDQDDALDTFGTCGTAAPGAGDFERVACSLPHTWRALTTIRIADSDRYPGAAEARQSGDEECADYVEEQAGFTTEIEYGWEWPTQAQWDAGQRFGFCWAPA